MPRITVQGIPVLWEEPQSTRQRKLVIWLPGFTDKKESMHRHLKDFALAGYVALSFDPVDHGERSRFTAGSFAPNSGDFRSPTDGKTYRHFWSILAETIDETSKIIDWALAELKVAPDIGMGGKSMGGDISVAATAQDPRIKVVAACIATADWLKPGSIYELSAPNNKIQSQYERCNPLTNIDLYRHLPAISFQCSAEDTIVPADGATRFIEQLEPFYTNSPERIEVVLEDGIGHELTDSMWQNALSWFNRFL